MGDFQNYLLVFLISVITAYVLPAFRKRSHGLPPGPIPLPLIGHFHLLGSKYHLSFQKLSNRYGPVVHLFLGSIPTVVVGSPEVAKELLQTHDAAVSNHPKGICADILTYGSADMAFAPYGPCWRFMKKVCMTTLLGLHTLLQFEPIWREERNLLFQTLLEKAKIGEAVDVKEELLRLTNDIASRMVMSQRCSSEQGGEAAQLRNCIVENLKLIVKFNLADYIWLCKNLDFQGLRKKAVAGHIKLDVMTEKILKEHEEARRQKKKEVGDGGNKVKDLIDILLDIMEDESAEIRLTRDNVKAIIHDMFGGATESPAAIMECAVAELINHPNVVEKARREIDSTVGKRRLVDDSDIPNLPYVQAIVRETLRLHPPFRVFSRKSSKDCTVAGYNIPANTQLIINVWALGRDPNYWEKPDEFLPDRFLDEDGSVKKGLDVRGHQFQLLPFGSGRRTCPGASLGLHIVQTTIAAIIQCFDWKIGEGGNLTSVDMEEGHGIGLAHPMVCVPVARFNPFACGQVSSISNADKASPVAS